MKADERGEMIECRGSPKTLEFHFAVCRTLFRDGNLDVLEEKSNDA